MHKDLFLRIVEGVIGASNYTRQRLDARCTLEFDPIQKYTIVFRMLAYDTHYDSLNESFRMFARTT